MADKLLHAAREILCGQEMKAHNILRSALSITPCKKFCGADLTATWVQCCTNKATGSVSDAATHKESMILEKSYLERVLDCGRHSHGIAPLGTFVSDPSFRHYPQPPQQVPSQSL